jgi:TPR repeat protein
MYANGHGVPEDNVLAYMWWSIAITNEGLRYPQVCINAGIRTDCEGHYSSEEIKGVKDAMEGIKILEKKMTPQQIEEAEKMAMKWKRKTPDPLLP